MLLTKLSKLTLLCAPTKSQDASMSREPQLGNSGTAGVTGAEGLNSHHGWDLKAWPWGTGMQYWGKLVYFNMTDSSDPLLGGSLGWARVIPAKFQYQAVFAIAGLSSSSW